MASELAARKCVPCKGDTPPLKGGPLDALVDQLGGDWNVVDEHHLQKLYRFPDFREALAFTNRVGEIAEEQSHHPDIQLAWGRVRLTIWTHTIDGLAEGNDLFPGQLAKYLFDTLLQRRSIGYPPGITRKALVGRQRRLPQHQLAKAKPFSLILHTQDNRAAISAGERTVGGD